MQVPPEHPAVCSNYGPSQCVALAVTKASLRIRYRNPVLTTSISFWLVITSRDSVPSGLQTKFGQVQWGFGPTASLFSTTTSCEVNDVWGLLMPNTDSNVKWTDGWDSYFYPLMSALLIGAYRYSFEPLDLYLSWTCRTTD